MRSMNAPHAAPALFLLCALGSAACQPDAEPTPPRHAGAVIDPHVHVLFDPGQAAAMNEAQPPTPEAVLALVDADPRLTVGAMVMARGAPADVEAQNDQLLAFAGKHERIFPIASINPHNGEDALLELERLAEAGVRWIKLHPNTQKFDVGDPEVAAVVAGAGAHGLVVTFDASMVLDADQLGKFVMLAASNPDTTIVLAHMGMARFDEMIALKLFESYPWWNRNVWLELSVTNVVYADSPREEELRWLVRQVGVDRTLFASDFPFATPAQAIDATERLGFEPTELELLFEVNAAKLLGGTRPN